MDKSILEECRQKRRLVDVRFDRWDISDLRGHVLRVSEHFVILAKEDQGESDGLSIFPLDEVTLLRWDQGRLQAWDRIMALSPPPFLPEVIDLDTWSGLITSLAPRVPLISFHRDGVGGSTCYIGKNIRLLPGTLVAEEVTPEGEVDGWFALRLEDLTRVEVLGRYEQALHRMLAARAARSP